MKSTYRITLLILACFAALFVLTACAECDHNWSAAPAGESVHKLTCTLCSATKDEAHNLSTSKTPASCDKPSVVTYSCSKCGYSASYADGEPSSDHTWGAYQVTREATCRQEGIETRVCSVCTAKETRAIEKAEHNYGDWQAYDEKWHIR